MCHVNGTQVWYHCKIKDHPTHNHMAQHMPQLKHRIKKDNHSNQQLIVPFCFFQYLKRHSSVLNTKLY